MTTKIIKTIENLQEEILSLKQLVYSDIFKTIIEDHLKILKNNMEALIVYDNKNTSEILENPEHMVKFWMSKVSDKKVSYELFYLTLFGKGRKISKKLNNRFTKKYNDIISEFNSTIKYFSKVFSKKENSNISELGYKYINEMNLIPIVLSEMGYDSNWNPGNKNYSLTIYYVGCIWKKMKFTVYLCLYGCYEGAEYFEIYGDKIKDGEVLNEISKIKNKMNNYAEYYVHLFVKCDSSEYKIDKYYELISK